MDTRRPADFAEDLQNAEAGAGPRRCLDLGFIYINQSPCASYVSDTTQADARFPAQAIVTQSSRP